MGKKPVVGLAGLVWAAMLVAGCGDCCHNRNNTRNKGYNVPPAFQSKNTKSDGVPADAKAMDKDLVAPPKPGDAATPVVPAGGLNKQASANPPADGLAPVDVKSLTPTRQTTGFETTNRVDTNLSRPGADGMRMPPPPTRTTGQDRPAAGVSPPPSETAQPLPPISSSSTPTTVPPVPPAQPAPLPPVPADNGGSFPPAPPMPPVQ